MNLPRHSIAGILCICMAFPVSGKEKNKKKVQDNTNQIVMENALDSISFCLGNNIGNMLKKQALDSLNLNIFFQAFKNAMNGYDTLMTTREADSFINSYFEQLSKQKSEKNLKEGSEFLEENKKKEGVITLESGLQYLILKEGTGQQPKSTDRVSVHYHGTLINGTVFDSSVERGQPVTLEVSRVIKGWTEALQLMTVGSKWRLFIPADLAYGDRSIPEGGIQPNSVLVFEVELLAVLDEEF